MKTIIANFEVYEYGHEIGYLSFIFKFLKEKKIEKNYIFLLNQQAEFLLKDEISLLSDVVFIFLNNYEQNKIEVKTSLFFRKDFEWQLIQKYSNIPEVSDILLMNFDQYIPSIILRGTPKIISGIYFRPSTRIYKETTSLKTKIMFYIKKSKKYVLEFLLFNIYKKKISNIFLLNDSKSVSFFNKSYGNNFYYLPDPIFGKPLSQNNGIEIEDIVGDSKIVFLLFGAISPRKNVENILKAYQLLSTKDRKNVILVIAGSIIKDYKVVFYELVNNIKKTNNNLNIIVDERFLTEKDMHLYFQKSDLILIPYKDLYTSSGILGIAASHNKPCMVSEIGLLAELVDEYDLGIKVNPFSSESISNGMKEFLKTTEPKVDGSKFCDLHKSENFNSALFQNIYHNNLNKC